MAEVTEPQTLCRIGAGSFAAAYVYVPRANVVIKRCFHRDRKDELREEYRTITHVFNSVKPTDERTSRATPLQDLQFRVIRPYRLLDGTDELTSCLDLQQNSPFDDGQADLPMYTMRRVWSMVPELRKIIRTQQFPEQYRNYQCEFIARVYLGREKSRASMFFNPNNWPLSIDRLKEVGFDTKRLAISMGHMLGNIVCKAGMDARDIEWVVGASDEDPLHESGFYIIDFNQCKPHNGDPRRVVDSMKVNDPYYPRPGGEEFECFTKAFLLGNVGSTYSTFAQDVMHGWESHWSD
ncbi:hypothetical protein DFJ77DRAFT_507258 [Powellomyces hirtus]|nr:hypothetical protein DFJ77DRAFT_507258 [Powellomyces hirtus]